MSHSAPQPDTIDCVFATILGFLLPFYLVGTGGDVPMAQAAIRELIEAYNTATAAELDMVGRLIGYGAAAMDSLRLSTRTGLSDRKVLQYRANAIALGRSAEQCRKVLEAMQAKREQVSATASLPHPPPMPSPRPAPVAPLPPAAPPPKMPPAQPQASENSASGQEDTLGFTPDSKMPDSKMVESDLRAMMANLYATAVSLGLDMPDESIGEMTLHGIHPPAQDQSAIT